MTLNKKQKIDFIGIGAAKAASTWIFTCLNEHPEICSDSRKETNFFSRYYNYKKGIKYYYSLFSHCSEDKIKGEFSPTYISSPQAPYLIYKHFPEVKLIACLRNPVDRAYSEYNFRVRTKSGIYIYKTKFILIYFQKKIF